MLGRIFQGAEERALTYQTLFESGGSAPTNTLAGVSVSEASSLRIATVYACVRLIADSISTLPVDVFVREDGTRVPFRPRPEWLDRPESGVSRTDHFQMVLVSLLLNGNAFVRVLRDDLGVVGLSVLNPTRVEIVRNPANRRPEYLIDNAERVSAEEMIHVSEMRLPGELRGKSRIELVSETLAMEKALTSFAARFFGSGSSTSGIIEVPGNLTREQAGDLASAFDSAHRNRMSSTSFKTGILSGGAKYTKTSVEPNEAQMLESRQFAVEEIARIFRCPPQMLGVTTPGAQSYASVEMNMISFVQNTLRTYIVKLEDAYSRLLPADVYIRWNTNGLLRGDAQSRMAAYSVGLTSGIYSIQDVRAFEDLEPVAGGDVHRVPLANVDLAAANLAEMDKKILMAQRLVTAGFEPASVLEALGLPAITHSGVPSVLLQGVAQINPDAPEAVYQTGDA